MIHRSTPTNHVNPDDAPLLIDPVGVDRHIQVLQVACKSGLPWLNKSFGRAWHAHDKSSNPGHFDIYPQVWQGENKDLLSVSPGNDNVGSYSFWRVHEPSEFVEYVSRNQNYIRTVVSGIFWMDLKIIDPTSDHDYTEALKLDIQRVIANIEFPDNTTSIRMIRIWETIQRVYETYTVKAFADQVIAYPRKALRVECEITYLEDCNP